MAACGTEEPAGQCNNCTVHPESEPCGKFYKIDEVKLIFQSRDWPIFHKREPINGVNGLNLTFGRYDIIPLIKSCLKMVNKNLKRFSWNRNIKKWLCFATFSYKFSASSTCPALLLIYFQSRAAMRSSSPAPTRPSFLVAMQFLQEPIRRTAPRQPPTAGRFTSLKAAPRPIASLTESPLGG